MENKKGDQQQTFARGPLCNSIISFNFPIKITNEDAYRSPVPQPLLRNTGEQFYAMFFVFR